MPRAKRGTKRKQRIEKVFDRASGFVMGRGRQYRQARQATDHALQYAYRDRRNRKRDFRGLWIARLSAASKLNETSYSKLMNGIIKSEVLVNRKMLSEIAIHDPSAFSAIVKEVTASA